MYLIFPHIRIAKPIKKKFLGIEYEDFESLCITPAELEDLLRDFCQQQESPLLFVCPDNKAFAEGIGKGNVRYIYHHLAGGKRAFKEQTNFQNSLKQIIKDSVPDPKNQAAFLPEGFYGPIKDFPGGEFTVDTNVISKNIQILKKEEIIKSITPLLVKALVIKQKNSSDACVGMGDDLPGYYAYYEV